MLLSDLAQGQRLTGLVPNATAEVVAVQPYGPAQARVTYRTDEGLGELMVNEQQVAAYAVAPHSKTWGLGTPPSVFKAGMEAYRIRLAHLFDPMMAVHTSDVMPLPHQITAVYDAMLPRQPLRFVLADDPGAGKTIMAGLLVRELLLRGDADRILIVAPGSLVEQWQEELRRKFDLAFDLFHPGMGLNAANPFDQHPRLIARLDALSRSDELRAALHTATPWDLIVFDEAHKLSATYTGRELKKTARYTLGEALGDKTRHLLLMTATPHRGKKDDFEAFLALLDHDRFAGRAQDHRTDDDIDTSDLMRRLVKEELVTFEGTPLFPERLAYTVDYTLSDDEQALYDAVTSYVRQEMDAADKLSGKAKNIVGFALTILQRRLASSPEAIYQSLSRRRKRLDARLEEARRSGALNALSALDTPVSDDLLTDDSDAPEDTSAEVEQAEEAAVTAASSAQTLAELEKEIVSLRALEAQALAVCESGRDCKWEQLSSLLHDAPEMQRPDGSRRKLIVFTEHRDTLDYLQGRIGGLLGDPDAVLTIHGGTPRPKRLEAQERFRNDPSALVLLATDAAGEGVNLQVANLMVNYDLPWNPNRLEQRFGRIHRIGQKEVCHLWNLVARGTREGDVFVRLFQKIEIEREALGGKVFDVLGKAFEGTPLREMLLDAIRYGERPEVKAQLHTKIEHAFDHDRINGLLRERALSKDVLPQEELFRLRAEMDRAEARRLQPRFLRAFFEEAFGLFGGRLAPREAGRFEVRHVPGELRESLPTDGRLPVVARYERVTFEREAVRLDGRAPADLLHPGHPLMAALLAATVRRYGDDLRDGTVLVDDHDHGTAPRLVFVLHHAVRELAGSQRAVSERLQIVEMPESGEAVAAEIPTYLDYRAPTAEEAALVEPLRHADWLRPDALQQRATDHALVHLAPAHFDAVQAERAAWTDKTLEAVHARLSREIQRHDALIAREQQKPDGKMLAANVERFTRVRDDLDARLRRRTAELEARRSLASAPPKVLGVALVVPRGWLDAHRPAGACGAADVPAPVVTPEQRQRIERLAMEAVMDAERALGFAPRDVSALKCGWDVESPRGDGRLRMIEVKGRHEAADTVTVTFNEINHALNKPDDYYLAVARVGFDEEGGDRVDGPYYVPRPFTKEPDAYAASVTYHLAPLLERACPPSDTL